MASVSWGQEPSYRHAIGASWGVAFPVGKDNFTSKGSWVLPAVRYEYRLTNNFSAAASLGYEYAKESGMTSDQFNNDLLDGLSTRQLTSIPFQLQALYFIQKNRALPFQPYLGVGVGLNYAKFDITGELIPTTVKSNWAEIITAQAGFRFALQGGRTAIDTSLFWQHAGNGFTPMSLIRQQSIGIRIGVVVGI